MDISDSSEGSHLAQIDDNQQNYIVKLSTNNPMTQQIEHYECQDLECIINEFNKVEENTIFLNIVIKEIDEARINYKAV
ncbi:hypothetical protein INT47_009774 [Mucor saturninus]|uniref:Uncharacterized protein n=1 Tax=Mucor saturninus TaxID=64648 RepID=A0A8H7V1T2_9FUNG|nr:hypothetical protein INT47_009774 [Mucor saturninus]